MSLATSAHAQFPEGELKIKPDELKLTYQSYEEGFTYPCKAEFALPEDPYDFKVSCFDGQTLKRIFNVHLAITMTSRTVAPKMRMEILYWVNGDGATSWMSFQEASPMVIYEASQSVKDESASLLLELAISVKSDLGPSRFQ